MAEPTSGLVNLPVRVTSTHDKVNETTLRVHRWTAEERMKRVWKRLAMWWGGAIGAAVIPPHIPWFTIAFLGGPIAAWLGSRQKALVLQQDVCCPDCGTPATLDETAETWPMGARCSPCGHVFWIAPVVPANG